MKQTKYQLKNKLNVLLIESKKSPVVSVQMWVKTGSADEKKGEEGISHFIEHLVFKGTEKFGVGEIASTVEASGGELNAYTSFDQTVFYVTISKAFSNVALDVVSQMMGYPTFDPAEIDSEREVVCEEIKMGQDSPGRKSSQLMFATAFKKHAYGIPVIGYDKNVRSWSAKKISDYYKSRYVPSNMFLVISGDFETPDMKKKVLEYFGGFKPYKLKTVKRVKEPKQTRLQIKTEKYKIQDKHLNFVFKAPNVKHKDVAALDVLAMVLGQGDSSALVKKLRLEKPLVNSASAFSYNPQDEGLFAISAHYQGDHFAEITKEIIKQIHHFKNNETSWSDIKRARVAISSEQFYSVETVDGLANKAGSQEFYFKDQNAQKKYLAQINKLTPADIKKVAQKYLNLKTLNLTFLGDVDEKTSAGWLKTVEKQWKQLEKEVIKEKVANKKIKIPALTLKTPKISKDQQVERIVLENGARLLLKKSSDTPTVSAKIVFRGGARNELMSEMGLSELTSRVWIADTATKSESQVLQEIEENAIGLNCFSGKNTMGFSIDYLAAFEDKALSLASECILNSTFSSDIINREKQILEQIIKSKEDKPSSLCIRQFLQDMFGKNHPLAFDATGTSETLKNLNHDKVKALAKKVLSNKNLTIVVVGDYDKAKWLKFAKEISKGLKDSSKSSENQNIFEIKADKRSFIESTKEQSHVALGWRGLSIGDKDSYTLHVIEAILAGQGGRLFLELRDKNSLAYSVSPIRMESLETGYFGGYIACSHEKVDKAIDMFDQEFKKLTEIKVGEEELNRAKLYLIGQHDIGLQRKSAICNLIAFDEIYDKDFNESLNVVAAYNAVTADKVMALAKRLFLQPKIISVVGKKI